jgi:hypothetical protein
MSVNVCFEYTYFPNALFAIFHISLALMFSYWRYKSVVAKVITLHTVRTYFFFVFY